MLKVMIVDDEINVVEGLKRTADWATYNYEVCAVAYDGQEAFDLAIKTKPDLIITDITMPVIDGITLINNLKDILPQVRYIVLTCHEEFKIVQEAFRLEICDYIIKETMTREELYVSIQKASKEIYAYRETTKNQKIVDYVSDMSAMLDIGDRVMTNNDEIEKALKWLSLHDFDFQNNFYCMIYFCAFSDDHEFKIKNLSEQIKNVLERNEHSYILRLSHREYIMLTVNNKDDFITDIYDNICVNGRLYLYANLNRCTPCNLWYIYNQIITLRQNNFYTQNNIVMLDKPECDLVKWNSQNEDIFFEAFEKSILELDLVQAQVATQNLFRLARQNQINPEQVKIICKRALIALLHHVNKNNGNASEILSAFQKDCIGRMFHISDLQWLMDKCFLETITQLKQHIQNARDEIIQKTIRFVENNFGERIKLEQVAKLVSMNTTYFSRYFKKKMNINFVDYITNVRIEYAKKLMIYSNDTIESIAIKSGFLNVTYFNEKFKKIVQMTPSEYRKQTIGKKS